MAGRLAIFHDALLCWTVIQLGPWRWHIYDNTLYKLQDRWWAIRHPLRNHAARAYQKGYQDGYSDNLQDEQLIRARLLREMEQAVRDSWMETSKTDGR